MDKDMAVRECFVPNRVKMLVDDVCLDEGITYGDFAARGGLSVGYMCDLLNGKRPPTRRAVEKLARALGLSGVEALLSLSISGEGGEQIPLRERRKRRNAEQLARTEALTGKRRAFDFKKIG